MSDFNDVNRRVSELSFLLRSEEPEAIHRRGTMSREEFAAAWAELRELVARPPDTVFTLNGGYRPAPGTWRSDIGWTEYGPIDSRSEPNEE